MQAVRASDFMVVTAHPLATQAGAQILQHGGSAVDAAVAVQMVLGLVEPQSSGLGGGAFLLHYDAATKRLQSYDGRETAPGTATEDDLRYADPATRMPLEPKSGSPFGSARASGRSIGTPGVLRLLEMAHQDHGHLAWRRLFVPAIALAQDGFLISQRMAEAIEAARQSLLLDPDARAYFLDADLTARAAGTRLTNPAYAQTLQAIADHGAGVFYQGPIAQAIVSKAKGFDASDPTTGSRAPLKRTESRLELTDLTHYRAMRRDPICSTYRQFWVCGMGPPSSGGLAVAQVLGTLEHFDLAKLAPTEVNGEGGQPSAQAIHLVSEAQRMAYADRNKYVADPEFVALPGGDVAMLIAKPYLASRAAQIRPEQSMRIARAGVFPEAPAAGSSAREGHGTTHFSIVDQRGNVVAMTSSIESSLGSLRFTQGFLLNNQLTDFSFEPADQEGPIANRVGPNKRPRSSMAPTLVFHMGPDGARGEFLLATGSPGGERIIQFVVKTLVAMLDWKLDPQQAAAFLNFGASNHPVTGLGGEHPSLNGNLVGSNIELVTRLRALGHSVSTAAQSSGAAIILKTATPEGTVYVGGVDPRREGLAIGGRPPPLAPPSRAMPGP